MDDALSRRLAGEVEPSDEPKEDGSDMSNLGEQMVGGLAGLNALHASGWEPPADLEWQYEGDDQHIAPTVQEEASGTGIDAHILAIGAGIFLLAALPRLINLFILTNPENPGLGWYTDVFHHWQIGYLSSEIGFSKGFLTLWDLKGMEYFWGLLHPLVLALLFKLTGSISIIIPRLVSVVSSSLSIVFLFFILKKYFNLHVALAGVLLVILNPVVIFADSSGMQEPLGLMLMFLGVLLWPQHAFWAGIALGIGGMARAEYWVFGAGLVAATWVLRDKGKWKIPITVGWLIPTLAYSKYLLEKTGNPIYPVYWNFLGNAAGEWMADRPPDTEEIIATWVARIVLVIAVAAGIWILRNRPKSYLFFFLGIGNIVLLGLMWGLSEYVLGFESRVFIGRLLTVPYIYIGVLISILLLSELQKKVSNGFGLRMGWVLVGVVLVSVQFAWLPLLQYYGDRTFIWEEERRLGEEVASIYRGGSIAVPENRPGLTYVLAKQQGVAAESFQSQMYDPFFYSDSPDPLANWTEFRVEIAEWARKLDIRLLIFADRKETYKDMVELENWFRFQGTGVRGKLLFYSVRIPSSY